MSINIFQAEAKQKYLKDLLDKGQALQREGKTLEAEALYTGVLNDFPHDLNALFMMASCFQQQGKNGLAIALYTKLQQFLPNTSAIYNNLGGCYHQENFDNEAYQSYKMAERLTNGKDLDVLSNLGGMFVNVGEPEKAEKIFKRLFEISKDHGSSKWNYSLVCLEQDRFAEGFDYYEAGLKTKDRKYKDYKLPEWDGSYCDSIVVCGEQGIGDEIMFSSILEDLATKTKRIVYDCHPRLQEIMEKHVVALGNDYVVHPSRKEMDVEWVKDFGCQYRVNVGSLGKHFRRDIKSFDRKGKPFLLKDEARVNYWKTALNYLGTGHKVGISWFGGAKRTRSDQRSINLPDLMPLLTMPDIVWVNAQYNVGQDLLNSFYNECGIKIHHLIDEDNYFDWTMKNLACDYHISVCNSLVHTMGAYEHEVYCMTPKHVAWRYGLKEDRMVWYKSPFLIRQKNSGDWGEVISNTMEIVRQKHLKAA